MNPSRMLIFILIVFVSSHWGCIHEIPKYDEIEPVTLEQFETIVSYEDNLLAAPTIIKHNGDSHLFVYDYSMGGVLQIDESGAVDKKIGRPGNGPGEYIYITNIIVLKKNLYLVDFPKFMIHKYDKDGTYLSAFDYGELGYSFETPPFNPSLIRAPDPTNEPFVPSEDKIMLSSINEEKSERTIYELRDWDGQHISDLGEIPDGASFTFDHTEYRNSVENRDVPAVDKINTFAVHDRSDPDEIFLVYSAIPKIAKYTLLGEKLWEKAIPTLPEIDSLSTNIYVNMDRLTLGSRFKMNKYLAGTSTLKGDLYLAINSHTENNSPLWIHRFDKKGELTGRFKIVSEQNLPPIFDIDPEGQRMYVITEEGEIRVYPL